jgi:ElaA protein
MTIRTCCKSFEELSVHELYDLLQLRSEVFVLEQQCLYQDMDGLDRQCHHLLIYQEDAEGNARLIAYARLIAAGESFPECSIGRILTRTHGLGHGQLLMNEAMHIMHGLFGPADIRIGAQTYAIPFYEKFGFVAEGETYDEDGIEHIEMLRRSTPLSEDR